MAEKTRIKILKDLGKEGKVYTFECEEVHSGEIIKLKVFENKEFIDNMRVGMIGEALVNENWVNMFEELIIQEPVEEAPKQETKEVSKPKVIEHNKSVKNGARMGMIVNNAVNIAIAEMNKNSESKMIDLNRVEGLIIGLDTIITKHENK